MGGGGSKSIQNLEKLTKLSNKNEEDYDFDNLRLYFSGIFYLSNTVAIENYSQSIKAAQPLEKHKLLYKKSLNKMDLGKFEIPDFLNDTDIKDISCGANNWVAITGEGEVFTKGPSELNFLCLGRLNKQDESNKVKLEEVVKLSACGPFHTIVATESRKIFSWGFNVNCSTLGINGAQIRKNVQEGKNVIVGQCGRELNKNACVPGQIDLNPDDEIIGVSCGAAFSMVLTKKGTIYSWGLNDENQLARENSPEIPSSIPSNLFNGKVIKISCGAHHVLAITEMNIYGWGWNSHSQAGFPNQVQVIPKPSILDKISHRRIRGIAAGNTHSVCSTASGKVLTWGSNEFGELGRNGVDPLPHSVKIKGKVIQVSCGESTTAAICEDGTAWIWGRLAGKDLSENQYNPRVIENNVFVSKIEVGSTHWVVQVDEKLSNAIRSFSNCCFSKEELSHDIISDIDPINMKILQERIHRQYYTKNKKSPILQIDNAFISFSWQVSTSSQMINLTNPTSKNINLTILCPKDLPQSYSIYTPPDIQLKPKTKLVIPFTVSRKAPRPPEHKEDYVRIITIIAHHGKKPSLGNKNTIKYHLLFYLSDNHLEVVKRKPINRLETLSVLSQLSEVDKSEKTSENSGNSGDNTDEEEDDI
eukprot:TRINITY_DN5163_c0_g1_i1.p1 TRINITY_DN5163_c0_g1~~TRINITY_DN5163_c0_g1_i1.p1  ORF type:complete len:644 (-),score=151.25 TRINITY_DN5163_c0_g1_i1:67-1998(-)